MINGAKEITVVTANNNEYEVVLIGTDPTTDIALLKIDAEVKNNRGSQLGCS